MKKNKLSFLLIGFSILLSGCVGNSDYLIKAGKSEIAEQDALQYFLKNEHGNYMLNNLVNEMLLLEKANVTEDEISERIEELKATHGADNTKQLAQKMNTTEQNILDKARLMASELKLLRENANITDEEFTEFFQQYKDRISYNAVYVDNMDDAMEILNLTQNGETLENASHKSIDEYHLRFSWNDESSVFELDYEVMSSIENLKEGEISEPINKDGVYYIYEMLEKKNVKKNTGYYEAMIELANRKGFTMQDVYNQLKNDVEIKVNKDYKEQLKF